MSQIKMGELSKRTGLSIPTIKYYLREGLLEHGHRTDINQATYDESHVERLRLIRALSKVAGLPLASVREVVGVLDSESSVVDALTVTQDALVRKAGGAADSAAATDPAAEALLAQVIEARGWHHHRDSPAHQAAVRALSELNSENLTAVLDRVDEYSRLADEIARIDLDIVASADTLEDTVRLVVLGSTLRGPVLDAFILIAQQRASSTLFDDGS